MGRQRIHYAAKPDPRSCWTQSVILNLHVCHGRSRKQQKVLLYFFVRDSTLCHPTFHGAVMEARAIPGEQRFPTYFVVWYGSLSMWIFITKTKSSENEQAISPKYFRHRVKSLGQVQINPLISLNKETGFASRPDIPAGHLTDYPHGVWGHQVCLQLIRIFIRSSSSVGVATDHT